MARRRLAPGEHGEIGYLTAKSKGYYARVSYRSESGEMHKIQGFGTSKAAARNDLTKKLEELTPSQTGDLSSHDTIQKLAQLWIEEVDDSDRQPSTKQLYARNVNNLVLPSLGQLHIRELTVGRTDRFLKRLRTDSSSKSKQARVVLSLMMDMAVRYGATPLNPVGQIGKQRSNTKTIEALDHEGLQALLTALEAEKILERPGPHADNLLIDAVTLMVVTSARIGEALALQLRDFAADGQPITIENCRELKHVTVDLNSTLVTVAGSGTYRQDVPKTHSSNRIVTLPQSAVDTLTDRISHVAEQGKHDAFVFQTRKGTPVMPCNFRRRLRAVRQIFDLPNTITPHTLRRSIATFVTKETGSLDLASKMLGHAGHRVTEQHYVKPSPVVSEQTAEIADRFMAGSKTDLSTLKTMAHNPYTPSQMLNELAENWISDTTLCIAIAHHSNAAPRTLAFLAGHASVDVRLAVASNPHIDASTREALAQDKDAQIRRIIHAQPKLAKPPRT